METLEINFFVLFFGEKEMTLNNNNMAMEKMVQN